MDTLLYNVNALDAGVIATCIADIGVKITGKVRLLLHAIARGNLKPLITEGNDEHAELSTQDIQLTGYAMGYSLLDWTRGLLKAGLFHTDARVVGLTSEGVDKYWEGYAAVSIAKGIFTEFSYVYGCGVCPVWYKGPILCRRVSQKQHR